MDIPRRTERGTVSRVLERGSGKGGKRKGESKSAGPTRVRAGRGRVWAVSIRTADSAFTILERRNFTHAATVIGNTI